MAENKKLYINTDEKHEPTDVIYSNLYASDELKAATLRKMKEIKRENERRQALRSKIVKRAMLTAAIIALVIAVTPLRGYVASATDAVSEAFHSWMEDVFHVGIKKTDNGCTVEIIEARVANDFLYLTINEDCGIKYDDYNDYDDRSDDEGNSVKFSMSASNVIRNVYNLVTDDRDIDYDDENYEEYQIYIPELKKVINSYDKNYTCNLNLYVYKNYQIPEAGANFITDESTWNTNIAPSATLCFSFPIKNIDYVINSQSKVYDIDYSIKVDDIEFDFQKMYIDDNVNNTCMVAEVIPLNGYNMTKFNLDPIAVANTYNWNGYAYDQSDDTNVWFGLSYKLSDNIDSYYGSYDGGVYLNYFNGRYYAILNVTQDCHKILLNLPMPMEFKVINIGYWEKKGDSFIDHDYYLPTLDDMYYLDGDIVAGVENMEVNIKSFAHGNTAKTITYDNFTISFKDLVNEGDSIKIHTDINLNLGDGYKYKFNRSYISFNFEDENEHWYGVMGKLSDDGKYINIKLEDIPYGDNGPTFDELMNFDKLIIEEIDVNFSVADVDNCDTASDWRKKSYFLYNSDLFDLKSIMEYLYNDKEYEGEWHNLIVNKKVEAFQKINTFTVGD